MMKLFEISLAAQQELVSMLEDLCSVLELPASRAKLANERYESVARHFDDSTAPLLQDIHVYPQGSMSLQTTVRPCGREDYDLDLVVQLAPNAGSERPTTVKRAVGDRFREKASYARILEEMNRCWRLDYASNERFHLDALPSVRYVPGGATAILVPDRELQTWKVSDPAGFGARFEQIAAIDLVDRVSGLMALREAAKIDPLPEQLPFKGPLRRIVQVAKHHRDRYFAELSREEADHKPISVIITTLIALAYERQVQHEHYSEFEFLVKVVRDMPNGILYDTSAKDGPWVIRNPACPLENFAERWNVHPERRVMFDRWHEYLVLAIETLAAHTQGRDKLIEGASTVFGEDAVRAAQGRHEDRYQALRDRGSLRMSSVGLSGIGGARVASNTFYGR